MRKLTLIFLLLCTLTTAVAEDKQPGKVGVFFCRTGQWIDNILMRGIDSNYIALPEYSWRVSLTTGGVGLHSSYSASNTPILGDVKMSSMSRPSLDLGFNAGYRALVVGYNWDLLHAYAKNFSISLGSKMFGLEFTRLRSTSFNSTLFIPNYMPEPQPIGESGVWITHTNASLWYALNWAHYSHNAAIKQAFLQRKTAGSLLLSASYTATDIAFTDKEQVLPSLLADVQQLTTHQASVGLGYGINYTPNQGKVILHLAATAKLVCYSINQIYYLQHDSTPMIGRPCYSIRPEHPVHVSGTMRAAVSWEINKYVNMSVWGQADNVRFQAANNNERCEFSNWNWHAHLNIGVRFGVGKTRVRKIIETADQLDPDYYTPPAAVRRSRLPQWITDYFFSPRIQ